MAKHQASRYRPGTTRCSFWKKIKPWACVPAVIFGYVPGRHGLRRLLVAAVREGRLRFVAELHSGLNAALRGQLAGLLAGRGCSRSAVPCRRQALWVRPELYCQVRFLGWTTGGLLRGARFAGLLSTLDATVTAPTGSGGLHAPASQPESCRVLPASRHEEDLAPAQGGPSASTTGRSAVALARRRCRRRPGLQGSGHCHHGSGGACPSSRAPAVPLLPQPQPAKENSKHATTPHRPGGGPP